MDRARTAQIPMQFWSRLQKGEVIEAEGRIYQPSDVLGPARKVIKVTYCTDTRPVEIIARQSEHADLFICEGMHGQPEKAAKAVEYKHMTFEEAAHLAKKARPRQMWLTHYSPSLNYPEEFMKDVRAIFKNSVAAKDGQTAELVFEEA